MLGLARALPRQVAHGVVEAFEGALEGEPCVLPDLVEMATTLELTEHILGYGA